MLRDGVLNDANPSPVGRFLAASRHVAERQPAVLPAMRAQVFGHSLLVPGRPAVRQHREHEAVRSFVQEQLAAIEVARLLEKPQHFALVGVAVLEQRNIVGQEPRRGESGLVLHQKARDVPIGDAVFLDAEVPAPLGKRLLENRRQPVDLRAGKVGVERQPLARQLADAGRGGPCVVDRRSPRRPTAAPTESTRTSVDRKTRHGDSADSSIEFQRNVVSCKNSRS